MGNISDDIAAIETLKGEQQETTLLPDVTLEQQQKEARIGKQREKESFSKLSTAELEQIEEKMKEMDRQKEPGELDFSKIPRPTFDMNKQFIIASAALMVASVVGAAYLRTGSQGMMSALTAGINGLVEGKKARFEIEMKNYNNIRTEMIQKQKAELSEYQQIQKAKGQQLQEMMTRMKLAYIKHGNDMKRFDATINGINRLIETKSNLITKFTNQTKVQQMRMTGDAFNYAFALSEFRERNPGLTLEQAKLKYPFAGYVDKKTGRWVSGWIETMRPDAPFERNQKKNAATLYVTPNGPKTRAEITNDLTNAGYKQKDIDEMISKAQVYQEGQ